MDDVHDMADVVFEEARVPLCLENNGKQFLFCFLSSWFNQNINNIINKKSLKNAGEFSKITCLLAVLHGGSLHSPGGRRIKAVTVAKLVDLIADNRLPRNFSLLFSLRSSLFALSDPVRFSLTHTHTCVLVAATQLHLEADLIESHTAFCSSRDFVDLVLHRCGSRRSLALLPPHS
jgi:hypothetical protein